MSFTTAGRALMLGIAALALAGTAQAQTSPTPEGTVIRNEATASYSDGTNSYTSNTAFVEVTVGFRAGVSVPADASQTPAANSTGNEYTFTTTNSGNGIDSVRVVATPSSANLTITGYKVNNGTIIDAATFETTLAGQAMAGTTGTVDITVVYSVANITGGTAEDIGFVVSSRRDGTVTTAHTLEITPVSVAVTPDGGVAQHRPGNQTATYTITNNSSLVMTYMLSASSSDVAAATTGTIVDGGTGGVFDASAVTLQLAAGTSGTVILSYTIPTTASPTATSALTLTATSTGTPSVSDAGTYTLTVQRPQVVITKQAWLDDESAQVSGPVRPGDYIKYRISVRNDGNYDATNVSVEDVLPAQVLFDPVAAGSTAGDAAGWTFTGTTAAEVKAQLTAPLGQGAPNARFFWIRVRIR